MDKNRDPPNGCNYGKMLPTESEKEYIAGVGASQTERQIQKNRHKRYTVKKYGMKTNGGSINGEGKRLHEKNGKNQQNDTKQDDGS